MIYIELMCGLGNQLFKIFCGIAYSLENKVSFKIIKTKQDNVSPVDNTNIRQTYWYNFFIKFIYQFTEKKHFLNMIKYLLFQKILKYGVIIKAINIFKLNMKIL